MASGSTLDGARIARIPPVGKNSAIALLEIMVGVIGGNFLPLQRTEWVNFLAGFGSILLTFLAGAEVEPQTARWL
jgi:Kef-type K+ transport system membrane component KefB